jgi:hypothetical protein
MPRFPDHGESLLSDPAVGDDVIGTVDVEIVDLVPRDELINVDGAGRLHLDRLEVFVRDFHPVPAGLVTLDDVVGLDRPPGLGIDLLQMDAMPGLFVDLVEANLLGLRDRRVEQDRAGYEGKAQIAFPVGARGHERTPKHKFGINVSTIADVPP